MDRVPETRGPIEIKTLEDPKQFMHGFLKSKWYKDAYKKFFEGKTLTADVTGKDKENSFQQSDFAKFALVDYGTADVHLKYNPSFYPARSRNALKIYLGSVEDLIDTIRRGASNDEISTQDTLRYQYHEEVAKSLVEDGILPTEKLGRALARLVLIDKKLDTESSAREPDILRLQRRLGI